MLVIAGGAALPDRQTAARDPVALGQAGFGVGARNAMEPRAQQLMEQGQVERQARGVVFSHDLTGTLRCHEVEALGERLAAETGRAFNAAAAGEYSPAPTGNASRSPPAVSQ
jgi:hypothetical protein